MEFDSKESEKQFNFNLIEFVRQNEVLYDPKHKDCRDNGVKVAIFKKFAEQHNMECEFVMRRWSNLRNSYQRIKRETRHIPDADGHQKSGKVWAFYQSLKFLDSVGSTFYTNRQTSSTRVRKRRKLNIDNGHKIGENEHLFTQTLDTYSDDDATLEDDEGTEPSNSEATINANDLLQFNSSILGSINDLSTNIKEMINQQQMTKLTQQKNLFDSNDSITLYLNSLRILLEPLSNDHLKFAKLQLKINQLVIDEIEKDQSQFNLS